MIDEAVMDLSHNIALEVYEIIEEKIDAKADEGAVNGDLYALVSDRIDEAVEFLSAADFDEADRAGEEVVDQIVNDVWDSMSDKINEYIKKKN